jgi:hypothetical protein
MVATSTEHSKRGKSKARGYHLSISVTATCLERAIEEAHALLDKLGRVRASHEATCQILDSSMNFENELDLARPKDLERASEWKAQCRSTKSRRPPKIL